MLAKLFGIKEDTYKGRELSSSGMLHSLSWYYFIDVSGDL